MIYLTTLLLALASVFANTQAETARPVLVSNPVHWRDGFKMIINFPLLKQVTGGWTMTLSFSKPTPNLQIWRAAIVSVSDDRTVYSLTNMPWNQNFSKCAVFEAAFVAKKDSIDVPTVTAVFHRKSGDEDDLDPNACSPTLPTTEPRKALEEIASVTLDPHVWPNGFKMLIEIKFLDDVVGGWKMTLSFSKPTPGLQIWRAAIVSVSNDKKVYTLENMPWNGDFKKCSIFTASFIAKKVIGTTPPSVVVDFQRKNGESISLDPNACPTTMPPSTSVPDTTLPGTPQPITTALPTTEPRKALEEIASVTLDPQVWPNGFKMLIEIKFLDDVVGGWKMTLSFSKPTPGLQIWRAAIVSVSNDKKVYTLENMPWNGDFKKCSIFTASFIAKKVIGTTPPSVVVDFQRKNGESISLDPNACPTTMPPSTSVPDTTLPGTSQPITTALPTTKQTTPSAVTTVKPTLPSSPSTPWPLTNGLNTTATIVDEWDTGFKQVFRFLIKEDIKDGWLIKMKFSTPVFQLQIWRAKLISQSDDNTEYFATNMPFNAAIPKCTFLEVDFLGNKEKPKEPAPVVVITFYRKGGTQGPTDGAVCATTMPPTTEKPATQTTANPMTHPATTMPPTTEKPATQTTANPMTHPETNAPATNKPTTEQPTPSPGPTTAINTVTTDLPTPVTHTETSAPATTQQPTDNPTTNPSTKPPTTALPATPLPTKYDYNQVLHDSILFYEAQRSGKLPSTNRIPWRGDSALNDKGQKGEDLTGGWYDAGDFVKFGFPMASSVTVLAWGVIEYRDAYKSAGELDNVLDSIKWATDYFIKAHTAKFEFYGQAGDGHVDHAYWGRPEDMTMKRPAYKITTSKPGSDLAAETAAALAATSIIFKETNPDYAKKLLKHAEELYEFADTYRGKYSDSITNAASFYKSYSGYNDELVWGAAWLYKATKKSEYLSKAESYYQMFGMSGKPWVFSWDDKKAGVQLLLAEITKKANYKKDVQTYVDSWLPGNDVAYTPKGLAWRDEWGPNRYAANTAFLALVAADNGIKPDEYRTFARKQINYMLGDSGRSFVVGFGNNPPKRPHHRSSSCPDRPSPCNHNNLNAPGANPQTLTGALVGGPDKNDNYKDDRKDYKMNEVATDYNAGFQSAIAGLKHLSFV